MESNAKNGEFRRRLAGMHLTSLVRLSRPKFSATPTIFLSWRREAILV
jgi:hypothetical protein